jgi:hypothetical protein
LGQVNTSFALQQFGNVGCASAADDGIRKYGAIFLSGSGLVILFWLSMA